MNQSRQITQGEESAAITEVAQVGEAPQGERQGIVTRIFRKKTTIKHRLDM